MAHSEKVRCAVIGAGGFAEVCHVPGLQAHPRAEVVVLCGRSEERRRAMAARLGVPETAADYGEVVTRPDIDAVNWVLGPVVEVCGMLHTVPRTRLDAERRPTPVDTDDLAHVWFRTAQGLQGEFRSSRVTPSHGDSGFLEVVGNQGALMAFLS